MLSPEDLEELYEGVIFDCDYEADDLPPRRAVSAMARRSVDEYFSPEQVAELYGLSVTVVRRVRRLAGQDPETGGLELDERITFMVELHGRGMTVAQLSDLTGVSNGTMGRIVKGDARRLPKNYDGIGIPELLAARTRLSERAAA
jgi:hypothetical protein